MSKYVLDVKDSFADLERNRLRLEDNVAKLRKSLQYWQTWEAEYEGMKEEIEGLDDQHTDTELERVAVESADTLLNEKEVKSLLIDEKGRQRNSSQIVGMLSRRIDYVQQNVKTVMSLLSTAEEKLAASNVICQSGVNNEERLPLTEIREELDEEGNVISSSTSAPSDAAPQVAEALRKAGIKGFSDTSERISQSHIDSIDQEDQAWVTEDKSDMPATSILKAPKIERSNRSGSMSRDSSNEITEAKSPSRRKSVTFAEGTKLTDATSSKPKLPNSRRALKTINEIKRQAGLAAFPTRSIKPKPPNRKSNKLLEADRGSDAGHAISGQAIPERIDDARHDSTAIREEENDTAVSKSKTFAETTPGHPSDKLASGEENVSVEGPPDNEAGAQDVDLAPSVIPVDESPEDAALRRQMLRYSMSEVGAVVAEIELDEEDEDLSDASYTDDEDGTISDTSSLEEDEDEHGRTKRRVLDDAYLEEMRALEKKLNATAIQNVGPHGNGLTAPVVEKTSGSITRDNSFKDLSKSPTISSISKKVRFAEELDVRDPPLKDQSNSIVKSVSKPIKDNIVERVAPVNGHTQPTTAPKMISRFKSARAGNPTISPTKAAFDTPAADTLVERTIPKTSASPRPTSNRYHLPDHTNLTGSESPRLVPTGPSNRTHAPIVIERPYSAIADPSTAVEPDELDPALLHQQVATEYHIMRNRMVQRQGGFLATDGEKEHVPLTEEEGGAPKVSMFKAARLAKLR